MSQPPTSTPPGPKPYRAPVELFGSRGLIDSQGRTVKFSLPPPIRFGECRMTKGEVKELKALLRLPPDPPDVQPGTGQRASVKPSVRPNLRDITDDVVNARWFKRLVIHYLQVTMVTATAWRPDELAPKPEEDCSPAAAAPGQQPTLSLPDQAEKPVVSKGTTPEKEHPLVLSPGDDPKDASNAAVPVIPNESAPVQPNQSAPVQPNEPAPVELNAPVPVQPNEPALQTHSTLPAAQSGTTPNSAPDCDSGRTADGRALDPTQTSKLPDTAQNGLSTDNTTLAQVPSMPETATLVSSALPIDSVYWDPDEELYVDASRSYRLTRIVRHLQMNSAIRPPQITALTATFLTMHLRDCEAEAVKIFMMAPGMVATDIRNAKLSRIVGYTRTKTLLEALLSRLHNSKAYTTDDESLSAACHLLVAYLSHKESPTKKLLQLRPSASESPAKVHHRLKTLFRFVPHVHNTDLQLYGVRVGLVYGALATFMNEKEIKLQLQNQMLSVGLGAVSAITSAAVDSAPSIAKLPASTINLSVKVAQDQMTEFMARETKKLATIVSVVAQKFNIQVLRAAQLGRLATLVEDVKLTANDLDTFQRTASSVLLLVVSETGIKLQIDEVKAAEVPSPAQHTAADLASAVLKKVLFENSGARKIEPLSIKEPAPAPDGSRIPTVAEPGDATNNVLEQLKQADTRQFKIGPDSQDSSSQGAKLKRKKARRSSTAAETSALALQLSPLKPSTSAAASSTDTSPTENKHPNHDPREPNPTSSPSARDVLPRSQRPSLTPLIVSSLDNSELENPDQAIGALDERTRAASPISSVISWQDRNHLSSAHTRAEMDVYVEHSGDLSKSQHNSPPPTPPSLLGSQFEPHHILANMLSQYNMGSPTQRGVHARRHSSGAREASAEEIRSLYARAKRLKHTLENCPAHETFRLYEAAKEGGDRNRDATCIQAECRMAFDAARFALATARDPAIAPTNRKKAWGTGDDGMGVIGSQEELWLRLWHAIFTILGKHLQAMAIRKAAAEKEAQKGGRTELAKPAQERAMTLAANEARLRSETGPDEEDVGKETDPNANDTKGLQLDDENESEEEEEEAEEGEDEDGDESEEGQVARVNAGDLPVRKSVVAQKFLRDQKRPRNPSFDDEHWP